MILLQILGKYMIIRHLDPKGLLSGPEVLQAVGVKEEWIPPESRDD